MKRADGEWRLVSGGGWPLTVTASGATMKIARKLAYRRVDNIIFPSAFFSRDVGKSWNETRKKLTAWGYLDS